MNDFIWLKILPDLILNYWGLYLQTANSKVIKRTHEKLPVILKIKKGVMYCITPFI